MVSLPIEERLAFQRSVLRLLAERSTERWNARRSSIGRLSLIHI